MGHKCFISFKIEDIDYKDYILNNLYVDMIDKSLHDPINSEDEDYIMRKIRQDYLSDSTVTIFIIGKYSSENSLFQNQRFIKRELQASLYNGQGNTKNGILGIVLPVMYETIYKGSYICSTCGATHNYIGINNSTVIAEFSHNYYIPQIGNCSWSEDNRYCVLVKWHDFISDPNYYIDKAFNKRFEPVASKTIVKP